MAQKVDILGTDNLRRGTKFRIGFTALDENGDPKPITGRALQYTWRKNASDAVAAAVVNLTVGAGITITDGPAGEGEIILLPIHTATLRPRAYFHRLWCTDVGFEGSIIPGQGKEEALIILKP